MVSRFGCILLAILGWAACAVPAARGAEEFAVIVEQHKIPMRDGVNLAAKVFRPDAPGKFPALMLLRYWQTGDAESNIFTPKGYVCVLVDCRGRGASEGKWEMYVNDPQDGYDAQEWIGKQEWCDGKIGMFGQSYNAFTQTMTAPLANPHLKCIFPIEGQQTNFGHVYNDGVMQWNMVSTAGLYTTGPTAVLPHKPLDDPHFHRLPLLALVEEFPEAFWVKDWFAHAKFDDYWKSYGVYGKYDRIEVPAYFATGWYDNLVHENWKNFNGFRNEGATKEAREGTKIIVGPSAHGGAWGQFELMLRWYDYWLKGIDNGIDKEAPIRIYVMGADTWRDEHEWPLARTQFTKYYLHSGGKANSVKGDGKLSTTAPEGDEKPDSYEYDPMKPVYTMGGQISTNPEVWGPKDRSKTQEREDILVYTTEPLEHDIEVTGPVELKLFAASSAVDTDFTATLTNVHPDGSAIHICEGIRGVTFRESLENPTPIEPGKVYEYTISLWDTSQVFKAGHRIRVEVSSSNFPRYARNQNTGLPLGTSDKVIVAQQTIHHDQMYTSALILPVIPPEKE